MDIAQRERWRAVALALLTDYVDCLDGGRFEEWPLLFAERCIYRVTSAENRARGYPIALIDCDSRGMLIDRVRALREANIYEAHACRHLLGPVVVREPPRDGVLSVRTGFAVVRTMRDGPGTLFATGEYLDRIQVGEGTVAPMFLEKTVVCDSSQIDTLLVYPL